MALTYFGRRLFARWVVPRRRAQAMRRRSAAELADTCEAALSPYFTLGAIDGPYSG
jgi:hypothetical protein